MYRVDLKDCLNYLKEKRSDLLSCGKVIFRNCLHGFIRSGISGNLNYDNSVMNGNINGEFVEICYPELFFADHNHYTFWNNVEDNWLAAFLVKYILSGNSGTDEAKYRLLDQVGRPCP